ncbi:MAG: Zn-dependent alcohol dehydrogenase [Actinobacteria bacterium]|nr:Zn-dependent alcohol dehydrogenase [Actinomycetota bacterium]
MIKAALLRDYGKDLEVVDVDLAPLTPNQVRVRMAASGVCHSDLSLQHGKFPYPVPCVPGHEGAGVVEEVGEAVTRVSPGDHVVLSSFPACRDCVYCDAGQPFLCENGMAEGIAAPYGSAGGETVFAGMMTGTFGEMTQVLERQVVPIDREIPLDVAALVGCAVTTGVGAVLNAAHVQPGETVAVVGCGGVGLSVIMGAVVAGASRIVAVDLSAERLALAETLGATDVVDASQADGVAAVKALTGGPGVDHSIEVVGRSATIRQTYDLTRRGGTCTIVGAGGSDETVSFDTMEIFFSGRRIVGCVYGNADPDRDFVRFLDLYKAGRLPIDTLITERIGLDGINDAFVAMEAGEGARSVVVFPS